MTSPLERLNIINNVIPVLAKVNSFLSIPLILEYISTQPETYSDKDFLKTLRNFYLLDSGCIILDNFKQTKQWDVSNSLGAPANTYFINYDPSDNLITVVNGVDKSVIDITDDESSQVIDMIKISGLSRFENLKTTVEKITKTRMINVDKSQLPVVKISDNGLELDYNTVNSTVDDSVKSLVLNVMLIPYVNNSENITFLTALKNVLV